MSGSTATWGPTRGLFVPIPSPSKPGAAAEPVEVEWRGPAPKPAWNWWNPRGKQLVTQWRTTPKVADWNGDGRADLLIGAEDGLLYFFDRRFLDQ